MNTRISILALLLNMATVALAQHADIRPFVENGQLKTSGFIDSTSTTIPGLRVFGYDFGEFLDDPYFTQDPGFNAAAGSGMPAGSLLSFIVPDAGSFGLPSNLSYWNGTGTLDLNSWVSPGDAELRLSFGSSNLVVGDATGLQAGFNIQTVSADGSIHRHLNAFLNVGNPDPAEGIYLLAMELHSSDAGIHNSLPFFLVYNNGLSEEVHDKAIDWVQSQLVPEPTGIVLASFGALMGLGVWRRCVAAKQAASKAQRVTL